MTARAPGVLVLHGFMGNSWEVEPLAARLAADGALVRAPHLPGSEGAAALARTTWRDWYAGAEASLAELRAEARSVAVCGFSMGGLLSILLAARHPEVRALGLLAVPLRLPLHDVIRRALPLGRRLAYLPKLAPPYVDRQAKAEHVAHVPFDRVPVRAVESLLDLIDEATLTLPQVTVPTLIVHSRRDTTAPFANAERLHRALPGSRVHAVRRSRHVLLRDVDRDEVIAALVTFLGQLPA